MTPDEQAKAETLVRQAWIAGFQAARHWPNHGLPELHIHWESGTPRVEPNWSKRQGGWVG
jgi:hypothetical protein